MGRALVFACLMATVSAACTGSGVPDVSAQRCYLGSKTIFGVGETVEITLEDFADPTGHFHLSGSGVSGFTCGSHLLTKSGQTISTDLSDCLPNNVVVESIKYCSDQDTLEVKVNDKNIPWGAGRLTVEAKNVACGGEVKTTASCTGSSVPDVSHPRCYFGSKTIFGVGESVAITLDDFNDPTGHFHLSGSGVTGFTCSSHQFSRSGQNIQTDLSDCLPKGVVVEGIKYCSDQDSLEVKVNDQNIPWGAGKLTIQAANAACGANVTRPMINI